MAIVADAPPSGTTSFTKFEAVAEWVAKVQEARSPNTLVTAILYSTPIWLRKRKPLVRDMATRVGLSIGPREGQQANAYNFGVSTMLL